MVHINQCDIINPHVLSTYLLFHWIISYHFPTKMGERKNKLWNHHLGTLFVQQITNWSLLASAVIHAEETALVHPEPRRIMEVFHLESTLSLYNNRGYLVWSLLLRCYSRLLNMLLGLQSCITSIRAGVFRTWSVQWYAMITSSKNIINSHHQSNSI